MRPEEKLEIQVDAKTDFVPYPDSKNVPYVPKHSQKDIKISQKSKVGREENL